MIGLGSDKNCDQYRDPSVNDSDHLVGLKQDREGRLGLRAKDIRYLCDSVAAEDHRFICLILLSNRVGI